MERWTDTVARDETREGKGNGNRACKKEKVRGPWFRQGVLINKKKARRTKDEKIVYGTKRQQERKKQKPQEH